MPQAMKTPKKLTYLLISLLWLVTQVHYAQASPYETYTIPNQDKLPFSLVGRLQPNRIEMITAPSDGTIHSINKHVGDEATPNQTLITLNDEEGKNQLITLITELMDAQKSHQAAQRAYSLNQELYECGSESKNKLLEHQNKLKSTHISVIKAKQHLKQVLSHYNLSWKHIEHLLKGTPEDFAAFIEKPLYKHITSPSSGIIETASKPITIGQHVKQGESLYKISNITSYTLSLNIPDELRKYIKNGQPILARDYHTPSKIFSAYVSSIKLLKEHDNEHYQMTLTLHPDHSSEFNIGMPLEVLISKQTAPVVIPAQFISKKNNQFWVKKWSHDHYQLFEVKVKHIGKEHSTIAYGLLPGDRIHHDKA